MLETNSYPGACLFFSLNYKNFRRETINYLKTKEERKKNLRKN